MSPRPAPYASLCAALLLPALSAQDGFVERAQELGLQHQFAAGLDRVGALMQMSDWTQQGIALGDVDGDGTTDVVAVGRLTRNSLFLRQGGGYVDVADAAGIQSPELDNVPALGDHDRDGDLDLFLGSAGWGEGSKPGNDRLYRNEGAQGGAPVVFEDVSALAGVRGHGQTLDALWCDVQRDGWLDLYVCSFNGTPNLMYVNNGDGSFVDRAAQLGVESGGSTHVAASLDLDRDGLPELLVGNDWNVTQAARIASIADDLHLAGQPDGSFADVSGHSGYPLLNQMGDLGSTTMGIALGDIDYDGDYDVYRTQWGEQILSRYEGWPSAGGTWVQVQELYGVDDPKVPVLGSSLVVGSAVGWGCAFGHFDFDPWLDLYKVNGHVNGSDPRQQPNRMFLGQGPASGHVFLEVGEALGVDGAFDDRALAVGDLDRDNDLDLLVGPSFGALRYYENRIEREGQGGIAVELRTTTSAPHGIGAEVGYWDALGLPHVRPIGADAPCASQREYLAFLGLGSAPAVDVVVAFPSGLERLLPAVATNQRISVEEPLLYELSQSHYAAGTGAPLVVRAFAHDKYGHPLGAGARVRINIAGLGPLGPVVHRGHNVFERSFAAPARPGAYRLRMSFGNFTPRVMPLVRAHGPLDPAVTRVELDPLCVRAGSTDLSEVTVVPLDAQGLALGSGHSMSVSFQGAQHALVDLGDGRYRASLGAPTSVGVHPIEVLSGGQPSGAQVGLVAAGAPEFTTSYLLVDSPFELIAQAPHRYKFEVQPRDAEGRALGPETQLVVSAVPDAFGAPVNVLDLPAPSGRRDGSFFFVLEREASLAAGSATGTVYVVADGVEVVAKPYSF